MNDLFDMFLKPVISMIDCYKGYLVDGVTTKEKVKTELFFTFNYFLFLNRGMKKRIMIC